MKKFISMVMAAAMVASLVPATAFAATGKVYSDGVAQIVGELEKEEDFFVTVGSEKVEGVIRMADAPEVQIEIEDVFPESTTSSTDKGEYEFDVTYTLENAEFTNNAGDKVEDNEAWAEDDFLACFEILGTNAVKGTDYTVEVSEWDNTSVTFTVKGTESTNKTLVGAMIVFDLMSTMDNTDAGDVAMVSVESDIIGADVEDLVYVEVLDTGVKATIKEATEMPVEEEVKIEKKIEIKSNIDNFVAGQVIELKLSNGFEFCEKGVDLGDITIVDFDENEAIATVNDDFAGTDKLVINAKALKIEAVDAAAGDECELTVEVEDAKWVNNEMVKDTTKWDAKAEAIVIAVVLADSVVVSVDEDEDVPVYYSGVNKNDDGITEKDDHISLAVTMEESVADAWDMKDAFDINLPEGVYVVGMKVLKADNVKAPEGEDAKDVVYNAFVKAYDKGDFEGFEFGRKALDKVDKTKKVEIEFELELVADPGFVGDVTLEVVMDGESQEVVVANFVAPYVVEAAQNDVIIDYRYTAVSDIVVKEAEAGLWEKGLEVTFGFDRDEIDLEDEVTVDVNEESDMEVKEIGQAGFKVTAESDDEAAVVTLSDVSLYMGRSIAAGAYDLTASVVKGGHYYGEDFLLGFPADEDGKVDANKDDIVKDVTDFEGVVKEGYVNVITAGRDKDDASFTTKVVVPVGESYIVAGEQTVALDVPAYVSASGYTMLPVRAVAVALGILNNNVLWDQASKTVTILYGQRIITMTVGAKVINVNGSAIPASSSPEVVDGRTFLPMRDLATALGVTDITWDAATKTATLNGNK